MVYVAIVHFYCRIILLLIYLTFFLPSCSVLSMCPIFTFFFFPLHCYLFFFVEIFKFLFSDNFFASTCLNAMQSISICNYPSYFFKTLFIYLREKGRKGEKGRETSMCNRYINWLPLTRSQLGTWPAPQACALTRNRICDLLVHRPVHRPVLNPLSLTSQCTLVIFPLGYTSQGGTLVIFNHTTLSI